MANEKHTPAPWIIGAKFTPRNGYEITEILSAKNEVIATVETAFTEGEANAQIIASAPALLEAVRGTVKAWDSLKMGHHQTADVQRWLLDNMAPAIAALRQFLESEATNG